MYLALGPLPSVTIREGGLAWAVYLHLLKYWRTNRVLLRDGREGIEAEGGEDIPSGGLAIVFVATVAVGGRGIELIHHLTAPVLSFPGVPAAL